MYKKVKSLPDSQQDAALAEELENMLAKQGLSRHSSEKGKGGRCPAASQELVR